MAIERRNPFGPLDVKRLLAFEKTLPAPLPGDYRRFLVESNGADVAECENFTEVPGLTKVEMLFGLHDGPLYFRLDDARANFAESVPASLLIIASDPYGNYFGLELGDERRGAVFFVDHEQLPGDAESLIQVSESFTALLKRIGPDVITRPAPRSVAEAIVEGDAESLRVVLQGNADGRGFVHRALRNGNLELVRVVLEHGGDANERGGLGGETPLFAAARENRADIARLLLAHGADPNAKCDAGGTAMEMATYSPGVLEVLARAGAIPTTNRLREAVRQILGERTNDEG